MNVMLSVVALWNYDNSLFSTMVLPETVDRDVLIDSIFMEAGELCVLYPDATLFKRFLGNWSERKLPQWNRYLTVINAQYDLTHNYDRTETESIDRETEGERTKTNTGTQATTGTIEQDGTITDVLSDDVEENHTGTDAFTHTGSQTQTPATTQTKNVAAYNAASLVPSESTVINGTDTRTDNLTDTETRTLKDTFEKDTTNTRTLDTTDTQRQTRTDNLQEHESKGIAEGTERTLHAYGNIGVTTAQEMLQQEIDLIPELDIYKVITDDFISAFCIGVY